jgi:hypothetical protein
MFQQVCAARSQITAIRREIGKIDQGRQRCQQARAGPALQNEARSKFGDGLFAFR